jgi:hypothetical protein
VKSHSKISATAGAFGGALDDEDRFGGSVAFLGDFDGNGVGDLVVGAPLDDDGGLDRGAVWLLALDGSHAVLDSLKISDLAGGLAAELDDDDRLGMCVAGPGDLDGDGAVDLLVGASRDDDGGLNRGALHELRLAGAPPCAGASVGFRNAGANPESYLASAPLLGGTLVATVDLMTSGHTFALIVAFDSPVERVLRGGQVLLCLDLGGSGEFLQAGVLAGPIATLAIAIPPTSSLCGATVFSQAVHFGGVQPFALSNAQDLTVGI